MRFNFCFRSILFLSLLVFANGFVNAQETGRKDLLSKIDSLRAQARPLEDQFLEPSTADQITYAKFLAQSNTGLIRLLPREDFDTSNRLSIRGGGAYYSFTKLNHEYDSGSDIELQQDYLSVGFAGANYGFIAELGDVTLDSVTLASPKIGFISQYVPASILSGARIEQRRSSEGVSIDDITYSRRTKVHVGSVYVLRSIDYETSDTLVAFRVLHKDFDGSVVILWKQLKNYPKPVLGRDIE